MTIPASLEVVAVIKTKLKNLSWPVVFVMTNDQ